MHRLLCNLVCGLFVGGALAGVVDGASVRASASETPEQTNPRQTQKLDYANHIRALGHRLPGDGFHIVEQKPFVVVGSGSASQVRYWATHTVGWAVTLLKKAYFKKNPRRIIDIWLFDNKHSYRRYTKQLWGEKPDTPFGYYSPSHHAMVMNIATGGGTLVHEIVHPFIEANFPSCPVWFNEGLGSLYEQSHEVDGKIMGKTNWRLAGLQKQIKHDHLPSFKTLCAMSSARFYARHTGRNYAQARYLCYYLQQHELLRPYYHRFVKHHAKDPTGYKTLKAVLGRRGQNMSRFQQHWAQWVSQLSFPETPDDE